MSNIFSRAETSLGEATGRKAEDVKQIIKTPPTPAFSDIAKASNDLLNKDFYHAAASNLEFKTKAPTGVTYTVKGKAGHSTSEKPGPISGSLEGKYAEKRHGLTATGTWTTLGNIDTKIELDDSIAKGLKAEFIATAKPDQSSITAGKLNVYFKQPQYHFRAFGDLLKGPTVNSDIVLGHQGFVAGAEAGYDVQKAALTRWSLAAGYLQSDHSSAITASNNLSVFSASFFRNVNSATQAGAKATYDTKSAGHVGLELAARHQIDPVSFVKGKINDRGIAAVSYNSKINSNFTFGIGASFDTQKLNESTHTVGTHFAFEA